MTTAFMRKMLCRPRLGAWIETSSFAELSPPPLCRPRWGAWIETECSAVARRRQLRRPRPRAGNSPGDWTARTRRPAGNTGRSLDVGWRAQGRFSRDSPVRDRDRPRSPVPPRGVWSRRRARIPQMLWQGRRASRPAQGEGESIFLPPIRIRRVRGNPRQDAPARKRAGCGMWRGPPAGHPPAPPGFCHKLICGAMRIFPNFFCATMPYNISLPNTL